MISILEKLKDSFGQEPFGIKNDKKIENDGVKM